MDLPEKMSAKDFQAMRKAGILGTGKKGRLTVNDTGLQDEMLSILKQERQLTVDEHQRIIFPITPRPYLRVTKGELFLLQKPPHEWEDKYRKKALALHRYFAYKSTIKTLTGNRNIKIGEVLHELLFMVPMPESWSKKKKEEMFGKRVLQRPDLDNYIKAFFDAIHKEDSHIAEINGRVGKYWSYEPKIILKL